MTSAPERGDGAPQWMRRAERGNMFWLRVMRALSLGLGRRVSRLVLHGIALYFLLAAGAAGRASRDYLGRCLGRAPRWIDRYRHVSCFATTIHDRVYLLNDRHDLFDVSFQGRELVDCLQIDGSGALLLGAHFGSFEVLRAMARDNPRLKVAIAMYPENARRINATLAAINPAAIEDIVPLGRMDAVLELHRRLCDGALVGILADRAVGRDEGVELPFLGAPARFPLGPFRLAAMLQQPVLFMAGVQRGGNRYELLFQRLDADLPAAGREARARALLERYVALLEQQCRAAPYNWFNFYDFWSGDGRH